jgi:F-type H+-transporting ATPase subunit epsilon
VAENNFTFEVVTPARLIVQEGVDSIVVPAAEGYMGVLKNHAPLITALGGGVLRYRGQGALKRIAVSGGFMEVSKNKVIVLADTAERAEEIDVERARRAKERAEQRLRERTSGLDVARAEFALRRALSRLKAAQVS